MIRFDRVRCSVGGERAATRYTDCTADTTAAETPTHRQHPFRPTPTLRGGTIDTTNTPIRDYYWISVSSRKGLTRGCPEGSPPSTAAWCRHKLRHPVRTYHSTTLVGNVAPVWTLIRKSYEGDNTQYRPEWYGGFNAVRYCCLPPPGDMGGLWPF